MNYKNLEQKIITSFTEGVTLTEAEQLAGEFLGAQIQISEELKEKSILHRMLKADLKETAAKLFYDEATKGEKKPSDSLLQAIVDKDPAVKEATQRHLLEEERANELYRLLNIFANAHLHFRSIAKGKFE